MGMLNNLKQKHSLKSFRHTAATSVTRVAIFFFAHYTKMGENEPKHYRMSIKMVKWPKNPIFHEKYQPFPFQGPPKFT
jgi:hypothetical protein